MRAYWAVIQDSFREALASRVLWVLLVLITLLLALLAPVGYRQQVTRGLSEGSVRNLPQFIEHVRDQARQGGTVSGEADRGFIGRAAAERRAGVQDARRRARWAAP